MGKGRKEEEGKGVWSEFGILKLGMLEDCKAVLVYENILDEVTDMLLSEVKVKDMNGIDRGGQRNTRLVVP